MTTSKLNEPEEGSDHLPVEMIVDFPTLQPNEGDSSPQLRAMGGVNGPPREKQPRELISYDVGDRVLVKREELTSVAASEQRLWVPSTVKEVQGQLIRVRIDPYWLHCDGAGRETIGERQMPHPIRVGRRNHALPNQKTRYNRISTTR